MDRSAFTADQYAEAYPPGTEHGYWALVRNRIVADALAEARRLGIWSGTGRILDIGCGPGIVVAGLRERGYDAWGVEIATPEPLRDAAPYLSLGQDARALAAPLRDSVTAILLLDVVEHIEDPRSFLADIAASFPNCPLYLVTVPARNEIWSNYDTYYGHHHRYDRNGLTAALRRAGLAPQFSRYFFRPLYLAALLLALARRPRQVLWRTPRHLRMHRALAAVLYRIEQLLRPFPALPGLSLLAVAIRPPSAGSQPIMDHPVPTAAFPPPHRCG